MIVALRNFFRMWVDVVNTGVSEPPHFFDYFFALLWLAAILAATVFVIVGSIFILHGIPLLIIVGLLGLTFLFKKFVEGGEE